MNLKNLFTNHLETPTVLQMEATECGAASLTMILAYYGLWLPLEKVREECGVNRDGASAANILKAARRLGLEAKGKRFSAERLKTAPKPLILHWEFNHFVVLEHIDDHYAYLNDPAMGHRKVPWEDFITSYTGIALAFAPTEAFKKGGEKYNVIEVISRRLWQDKPILIYVCLLSFGLLVPQLSLPALKSVFMDNILGWKYSTWHLPLILFGAGTICLLLILTWLRLYMLTKWMEKLTITGSARFFWHVLRLPFMFYQQRSPSEVSSRVTFNESVANVLTGSAATALFDLVMAVFYLAVMCCYNIRLTLVGIFCSAVNIAGFLYVRKKLLELLMQAQMDNGKFYSTAVMGLMNIESIKANGNEDNFFNQIMGFTTKGMAAVHRANIFNVLLEFLPLLTAGISSAMVMTIGGFAVMDGLMTLGIYMAFQTMLDSFNTPVSNLLTLGTSLQNTEMQLKRLDDVLNYPEDSFNFPEKEPDPIGKSRLSGELTLRNLVFGFSKLADPLFDGFNLQLPRGNWVALVGGSGCGKSTLAKLINGSFAQWSGNILMDGIERQQIPRHVITNSLSMVDQDIFLFDATIEQNITMFDRNIRHQDVINAVKDACIYDDIIKLEGGFDHMVAEAGANFSGGQRQRLEIARALAINPSLLILDEATSALDPLTEKQVMDNIRHRGCSCIVIAHRLSTIRDCDEIIVLDHGKVLERGRHTQLLQQDGAYARLVKDQEAKAVVA